MSSIHRSCPYRQTALDPVEGGHERGFAGVAPERGQTQAVLAIAQVFFRRPKVAEWAVRRQAAAAAVGHVKLSESAILEQQLNLHGEFCNKIRKTVRNFLGNKSSVIHAAGKIR